MPSLGLDSEPPAPSPFEATIMAETGASLEEVLQLTHQEVYNLVLEIVRERNAARDRAWKEALGRLN